MLQVAVDKEELAKVPRLPKRKEYEGRLRWYSEEEVNAFLKFFKYHPWMGNLGILAVDTGFQRGVGLPVIQKWMDHSTIETTMRYAHLAPNALDSALEALTAAVDSHSGHHPQGHLTLQLTLRFQLARLQAWRKQSLRPDRAQ